MDQFLGGRSVPGLLFAIRKLDFPVLDNRGYGSLLVFPREKLLLPGFAKIKYLENKIPVDKIISRRRVEKVGSARVANESKLPTLEGRGVLIVLYGAELEDF